MFKKFSMQSLWPPVAAVTLFLLAWQGATVLFDIPKWILPSPANIVHESLLSFDKTSVHIAATIRLTLLGFAIGSAIGLVFSIVLHLFGKLRAAVYPLLILSQNVPIIALAPLLIIWFGFGLLPKLIVITLVCFFPIAIASLNGLNQTDAVMMNYMKMIGASRWQILLKLELPYALPYMFAGLKISATYSVMGAIMAEWLGTDKGIGMYMLLARAAFRTDRVFVAIGVIVLLSLLLFGTISLLERLLVRWRPEK